MGHLGQVESCERTGVPPSKANFDDPICIYIPVSLFCWNCYDSSAAMKPGMFYAIVATVYLDDDIGSLPSDLWKSLHQTTER